MGANATPCRKQSVRPTSKVPVRSRPHFGRSKFGELPLKADQFATATLRSFVDLQSLVRSNAMLVRDLMSALEADHIESFVVFDTIAAGLGKHGLTET